MAGTNDQSITVTGNIDPTFQGLLADLEKQVDNIRSKAGSIVLSGTSTGFAGGGGGPGGGGGGGSPSVGSGGAARTARATTVTAGAAPSVGGGGRARGLGGNALAGIGGTSRPSGLAALMAGQSATENPPATVATIPRPSRDARGRFLPGHGGGGGRRGGGGRGAAAGVAAGAGGEDDGDEGLPSSQARADFQQAQALGGYEGSFRQFRAEGFERTQAARQARAEDMNARRDRKMGETHARALDENERRDRAAERQERQMGVTHARALEDNERRQWQVRSRTRSDYDAAQGEGYKGSYQDFVEERYQKARDAARAREEAGRGSKNPWKWDTPFEGYGRNVARGSLYALGTTAANALNDMTAARLSGHQDYQNTQARPWELLGGVGGAAIGSLFGPFGSVIGASVGSQVTGAVSRYISSPEARQIELRQHSMGLGGMQASYAGETVTQTGVANTVPIGGISEGMRTIPTFRNPAYMRARGMARTARDRAKGISATFFNDTIVDQDVVSPYAATSEQFASMYSGTYGALANAGIDPEQMTDQSSWEGRVAPLSLPLAQQGINHANAAVDRSTKGRGTRDKNGFLQYASAAPVVDALAGVAMAKAGMSDVLQRGEGPKQSLYQYLIENAAIRYGSDADAVMKKSVDPILGSLISMGGSATDTIHHPGNLADILTKFGPVATDQYMQTLTPFNQTSPVALKQLMSVTAGLQQEDRLLQFGGTRVRGRSSYMAGVLGGQMDQLRTLPQGDQSLVFAQTQEHRRQANLAAYDESDITEFGMPRAAITANQTIAQSSPYSASRAPRFAVISLAQRQKEFGVKQARYNQLVQQGQLTESEQYQKYSELLALRTGMAQDIGALSNGVDDKLLMFSAGRPTGGLRADSTTLAAINASSLGIPFRQYGAYGGGQVKAQNDLFRAAGVNPHQSGVGGPVGKEGGLDSDYLKQILDELRKQNSTRGSASFGGQRPGEAANQAKSSFDRAAGKIQYPATYN